MLITDAEIKK